jgi:hypothetical protein
MSDQVEPEMIASQDETAMANPHYEPPEVILLNKLTIGKGDDDCIVGPGAFGSCYLGDKPG